MILEGGRIHTLDAAGSTRALAVTRDGRVARGVEAWEGDRSAVSSERIDLGGRTVVPGLVDAHVHFATWALDQARPALAGCRSEAEILAAVADRVVADREAGRADRWLLGGGWREAVFGDGPPTAALLDRVTGGRPCALWAHDRHSLWLNGAALRARGLDRDAETPQGGVVERDAHGRPTGILREQAAWAVSLPEETPAAMLDAVAAGQRLAHARGVTAVHDFERRGGLAIWQQLDADRRLTLRVLASRPAATLDAVLAAELRSGFGSERLRIGPIKAFMDGTLGSRTARMLEPYEDVAGEPGLGVEITGRAELEELVRAAAAGGLSVAVHAIGDRANREALDAFAAARDAWEPAGLRPRIEHAQLLHPDDVGRFAALGVVASMQPSHCPSDRDEADRAWGGRAGLAYAWRALRDAGTILAFGSDAPIEDLDPLAGLHAAVNRSDDGRAPWRPEQALSPLEALEAFTAGPAFAAGWQGRVGRLAPGLAADLVVLDDDPLTCPPERLAGIGVVATMVAGRWVHGRPPW